MRVAFYARVSTERQQQAQTIEQQITRLREYMANQAGWTVEEGHIFRDDGQSGAKLNRPGLDALRDQAARAAFERILITAPDRLARNYVHQMVLLEELERVGCPVQFIDRPLSDDPHEQLVVQIRGAVAEYERTLIADRMRRGRLAKLQSGRLLPWTRPPYGYRVNPERPRDPTLLQVDPAPAAIVEEIFHGYAEGGETLYSMATRLSQRKVLSPTGRTHWTASAIRCILTNPAYTGCAAWGKTRTVPATLRQSALKPVGSGESSRRRPAAEWITIPIPALINREQFDRVQQRLALNQQGARRNLKHEYLLRGLVSCGLCRLNCTGRERPSEKKDYRYYLCMGKKPTAVSGRGERCSARFIPAPQLDDLVWDDLCHVLQQPGLVTQELERAHSGAWLPDELRRRQATLRSVQDSLMRQRERLLDAYLANAIDLPTFQRKDAELRQSQEDTTAQQREIAAAGQRLVEVQALARSVEELCAHLRIGLEQATFEQRRLLVELLIDRVIVTNGAVEIRYVIPTTEASAHTRFCHLRTDYFSRQTYREVCPAGNVVGEPEGFLKVVFDATSGKLLGAHAFGSGAPELVQQIAFAMLGGLTLRQAGNALFTFPGLSEVVWYALRAHPGDPP
jgi:site-specific DNA recombinase